MQTMGNEGRLIVHNRCYNKELQCKLWVMKEDLLVTEGDTMQTIG
ncbi:hypothetical protein KSS87_013389, partial [Heliosperma pusillum]